MCRIVMSYVICGAVMLSMATKVSVATQWLNGNGDGKWSTAANWSTGKIPVKNGDGTTGDAIINQAGVNACNIDGNQAIAECTWMHVGSTGIGQLNVVGGGQIGVPQWNGISWVVQAFELFMSLNGGDSIINIDGSGAQPSQLRGEAWHIGATGDTTSITTVYGGKQTVNVTNGGIMTMVWWGNWMGPNATINVVNSTLQELGGWGLVMADSARIILHGNNAVVQFDCGLIEPWYTSQYNLVAGLLAAGKIITGSPRC
jgi:hypothetical protein